MSHLRCHVGHRMGRVPLGNASARLWKRCLPRRAGLWNGIWPKRRWPVFCVGCNPKRAFQELKWQLNKGSSLETSGRGACRGRKIDFGKTDENNQKCETREGPQ